ncbi:hypothetical protein Tco_0474638 [Tanacetum coccineum]
MDDEPLRVADRVVAPTPGPAIIIPKTANEFAIKEEDFNALIDEGSKILYSIEGTPLEDNILAEFDEFMAMTIEKTLNLIPIKKKYPLKKSPLILTIK